LDDGRRAVLTQIVHDAWLPRRAVECVDPIEFAVYDPRGACLVWEITQQPD
jgi:hypothetical protein